MSGPRGTGGSSSRRSPPRMAEDRDLSVAHRPARGLGLPPRIQSSEPRARGGYRGRGRVGPTGWTNIRPSGGSVPPWAERARQVDTYIPSYMPEESYSNPHPNSAAPSRSPTKPLSPTRPSSPAHVFGDRQPPTRPKWEREQSRAPIASPSRTLSSSPVDLPLDPAVGLEAPRRYSAGPSHQRWMSPDKAGPSDYATRDPRSRTTSPTQPNPPTHSRQPPTSPRKVKLEERSGSPPAQKRVSGSSRSPEKSKKKKGKSPEKRALHTIEDEKEDMAVDADIPEPIEVVEEVEEEDIKPDLSALAALDIPPIPEQDREEGVLAFKRNAVASCYSKDLATRSSARKAFRIEKSQELSALNRSIQHVLWRDDGVGVQWKKMRLATPRVRPPPMPVTNGESSTSARPGDIPHTSANAPTAEPATAKPDRTVRNISNEPTVVRHGLPPRPTPVAIDVSQAGPSSSATPMAHLKQPDSSAIDSPALLSKKERKKIESTDDNKRKANDETPSSTPAKPAKLPKSEPDTPVAGPSMTKAERKRLKRAEQEAAAAKKKRKEERQKAKLLHDEEAGTNSISDGPKGKGKEKQGNAKLDESSLLNSSKTTSNGGGSLNSSVASINGLAGKGVSSSFKPNKPLLAPVAPPSFGKRPSIRPTKPFHERSALPPTVRAAPLTSSNSVPIRPVASYSARPLNDNPASLPTRPPRPTFTAPSASVSAAAPPRPTASQSPSIRPAPPSSSSSTGSVYRPPSQHQPQYQPPISGGSYSERQALAALARPPQGGPSTRPHAARFTPRPPGAATAGRPPPVRPTAGPTVPVRPPPSSVRPPPPSAARPPPRPTLSSRSITPSNVSARYDELRKALSKKMEEIDNWTSMLTDLPDHAGQTERQIERTKAECFVLQKQMREEKENSALRS